MHLKLIVGMCLCAICATVSRAQEAQAPAAAAPGGVHARAEVVLTVAESKRLIARWVSQLPVVRQALQQGIVIIASGTTNTYVAEEILDKSIERGAMVTGRTVPAKRENPFRASHWRGAVILVDGKETTSTSMDEALARLTRTDVVIKGGNALNYETKKVAVVTGSPEGGTTGMVMPAIQRSSATLIVPIGLEKQVAGNVEEIVRRTAEPGYALEKVHRLRLLEGGEIITEIEALQGLTGVDAFQSAAGGIAGAEGAVRLVLSGSQEQVRAALELVHAIQGEPPFVE